MIELNEEQFITTLDDNGKTLFIAEDSMIRTGGDPAFCLIGEMTGAPLVMEMDHVILDARDEDLVAWVYVPRDSIPNPFEVHVLND